ncbi:hypothetical protein [Methylorubrum thiocyanatum]|uniref:hypothetical protein n=1 Tax=Methylorubrum thiocyanatum TaxID=47958 RepID=UPI00364EE021
MTEDEVNRAADASVKQGLSDIAANDRREGGTLINVRVAPWVEQWNVYVSSSPHAFDVRPVEAELVALADAILRADGQTPERDHDAAVSLTIAWKCSAWKTVGA